VSCCVRDYFVVWLILWRLFLSLRIFKCTGARVRWGPRTFFRSDHRSGNRRRCRRTIEINHDFSLCSAPTGLQGAKISSKRNWARHSHHGRCEAGKLLIFAPHDSTTYTPIFIPKYAGNTPVNNHSVHLRTQTGKA